jgi:transcription elongation factor GreB
MRRRRTPVAKSSPYITAAGFRSLESELRRQWEKRREVTVALAAAAAEGDRSENAEYTYRKKQLAGIDRRIRYLQRRLPQLKVVDQLPSDPGKIFFGATVMVEDEQGRHHRWRLVGADEIDASKGWISVDSPVARALLGRQLDDEFTVRLPEGSVSYIVCDIRYQSEET